jgi:hypothetical protein
MKKIINIIAALILILTNGTLIIIQLLGYVQMQFLAFTVFLILMSLAFILHKKWILYLAQTSIFLYPIYFSIENYIGEPDSIIVTSSQYSFLYSLIIIAFSYFLAWLVARSI